jgi:hypothetical protein
MRHGMRVHKYVIGHRMKTRASTLLLFAAFLVVAGGAAYWWSYNTPSGMNYVQSQLPAIAPKAGDVLGEDDIKLFTPTETTALAKENYGSATLPITTGISQKLAHICLRPRYYRHWRQVCREPRAAQGLQLG